MAPKTEQAKTTQPPKKLKLKKSQKKTITTQQPTVTKAKKQNKAKKPNDKQSQKQKITTQQPTVTKAKKQNKAKKPNDNQSQKQKITAQQPTVTKAKKQNKAKKLNDKQLQKQKKKEKQTTTTRKPTTTKTKKNEKQTTTTRKPTTTQKPTTTKTKKKEKQTTTTRKPTTTKTKKKQNQTKTTQKPTTTKTKKVKHNLDKTFFCVLRNVNNYAKKAYMYNNYPWIARVVHSKTKDLPHKCTAACIGPRLFVTAARCVTILVVEYTRVLYDGARMPVLAFVVPSKSTKQMFDDIGIIVVEATPYNGTWPSIGLINKNRTDNDYEWLDKLQLEKATFGTHKVVGYAKDGKDLTDTVYTEHKLYVLDVVVGMSLCYQLLQGKKPKSLDYWVPCYYSCPLEPELSTKDKSACYRYLGTLGAAVIDSKNKKLIGVATWGAQLYGAHAPVGFAIPNSNNFFEDLACAKKVLKDNGKTANMQSLCPLPKKKN